MGDFAGPLRLTSLADRSGDTKDQGTLTFGFLKPAPVSAPGFVPVPGNDSQLTYANRDVGPVFGGDTTERRKNIHQYFYKLEDFSDRGEMLCITFLGEAGDVQAKTWSLYLADLLAIPGPQGVSFGLCVNYENCIRNALEYTGSGIVHTKVRTQKRHVTAAGDRQWGYVHTPNVRGIYHAPTAYSVRRTRQGKPWEMKVSMVISGGRMWFIIDDCLYDPNIKRVLPDTTGKVLPGTKIDGKPTDLIVPIIKSARLNLVRIVDPDPTFTKVYIPELGEV